MITTHVSGERWLPLTVAPSGIRNAVLRVGQQMGVRGDVIVIVKPWASRMLGLACPPTPTRVAEIHLYDKRIRIEAAMPLSRTVRAMYAMVLAHELWHLAQAMRGGRALLCKTAEDEADAIERVYGPEVERWLRG